MIGVVVVIVVVVVVVLLFVAAVNGIFVPECDTIGFLEMCFKAAALAPQSSDVPLLPFRNL